METHLTPRLKTKDHWRRNFPRQHNPKCVLRMIAGYLACVTIKCDFVNYV